MVPCRSNCCWIQLVGISCVRRSSINVSTTLYFNGLELKTGERQLVCRLFPDFFPWSIRACLSYITGAGGRISLRSRSPRPIAWGSLRPGRYTCSLADTPPACSLAVRVNHRWNILTAPRWPVVGAWEFSFLLKFVSLRLSRCTNKDCGPSDPSWNTDQGV